MPFETDQFKEMLGRDKEHARLAREEAELLRQQLLKLKNYLRESQQQAAQLQRQLAEKPRSLPASPPPANGGDRLKLENMAALLSERGEENCRTGTKRFKRPSGR